MQITYLLKHVSDKLHQSCMEKTKQKRQKKNPTNKQQDKQQQKQKTKNIHLLPGGFAKYY